ncbi:hypothetical protein L1887_35299 [Cichorium endivia]|nr:hypothetical protein L1887_35299 [Cichorium endivia]
MHKQNEFVFKDRAWLEPNSRQGSKRVGDSERFSRPPLLEEPQVFVLTMAFHTDSCTATVLSAEKDLKFTVITGFD